MLQSLDSSEKLVEGVDHEEHILKPIDLERLIHDRIEIERTPLARRAECVRRVRVRGDESATVDLDASSLTDEPEFDGKPEESRHRRNGLVGRCSRRQCAESLEKIGEHRVGVQWNVAKDIVEDVWLRQVVELFSRTHLERCWKTPALEASEELCGRDEATHADGRPASAPSEALVHV